VKTVRTIVVTINLSKRLVAQNSVSGTDAEKEVALRLCDDGSISNIGGTDKTDFWYHPKPGTMGAVS